MNAGVAAVDFTPTPGLILQGHLSKNPSHTVLYPLEARALVLRSGQESLCIITLDVIGGELRTAPAPCSLTPPAANHWPSSSHTPAIPRPSPVMKVSSPPITPASPVVSSKKSSTAARCSSPAASETSVRTSTVPSPQRRKNSSM